MKNWVLFGEVFLKVWKFSAQSRETKKHFLWEKMAKCSSAQVFCCVEKSAEFFAQSSTNYSQVPREKNRVTRKNKNVLFLNLQALLKTLMKIFLPKLEYLRPQSIKSLFLWKKKNQKVHWIRKMKNWETSRRKNA